MERSKLNQTNKNHAWKMIHKVNHGDIVEYGGNAYKAVGGYLYLQRKHVLTAEEVRQRLCRFFGVQAEVLKSPDRRQRISDLRTIYCFCAVKVCGLHPREVADAVRRDRSTVLTSVKRAVAIAEVDRVFAAKLADAKVLFM